jgi:hypothetical protein
MPASSSSSSPLPFIARVEKFGGENFLCSPSENLWHNRSLGRNRTGCCVRSGDGLFLFRRFLFCFVSAVALRRAAQEMSLVKKTNFFDATARKCFPAYFNFFSDTYCGIENLLPAKHIYIHTCKTCIHQRKVSLEKFLLIKLCHEKRQLFVCCVWIARRQTDTANKQFIFHSQALFSLPSEYSNYFAILLGQ